MRIVRVDKGCFIPIGRLGEKESTMVIFDITDWKPIYGDGIFSLVCQRNGESVPYIAVIEQTETEVHWVVKDADVGIKGYGKCELIYTVGDAIAKSEIYVTVVGDALQGGSVPPEPWEDWVERVLAAGVAAQVAAVSAGASAESAEHSAEVASEKAGEAEQYIARAETAALQAEGYADDAQSAKTDAETAKADAETAKTQAETAKDDAETAKTGAESARDLADGSAEDAEAWAVGKRGGVDVPSTDPAYNNSSKYHADESKAAKEDIEDSIEGVAQEDTAQSALSKINEITGFLQTIVQRHEEVRYYDVLPVQGTEGYTYITPDGTYHFHNGEYAQLSGSGDLNGFSLKLGEKNEVLLSYTDPDDETITDTITMPTIDTINRVISALGDIVISLAKIAGQEE